MSERAAGRLRRSPELVAIAAVTLAAGCELAARSVARASLLRWMFGIDATSAVIVWCAAVSTLLGLAVCRWRGRLNARSVMLAALLCALPAGLAAQLSLGARLQSDGFYYFAHLRSLWFDGDQDLANDYRMLGLGDKTHLFTPTVTGHAQSAWTIGPAIVWSPFFAAGDRVAHVLRARGRDIAIDGTSYPYRQSICVAGLVWGLVGLYFCFLLAGRVTTESWAALATAITAGGSFMLWYLVKEPTMTHGPSMAAVAIFTWGWMVTRGRRSRWQWAALGLLAGFMGTIRWQNVLFALLPALEWLETAWTIRGNRSALARHVADGLIFTACAVVGFVPQMLAWRAIYGSYLAVSPIGPEIRWWAPQIADVLWSSRNGLFATSPVTYLGATGLVLCLWRDRRFAMAALATLAVMAFFNASIQDWWGSAAFGGRRFDGTLPLLVAGTAVTAEIGSRLVARRPQAIVAAAGVALVLWNLTFMSAALAGRFPIGEPVGFAPLAGYQASAIERWTGHPFSWPANLWFALRNGTSPADFDLLWALRILSDPGRPYGKIDLGYDDEPFVGAGWYAPEQRGAIGFRWASESASLRLSLDHAAPLRVQTRLVAFTWPGAPPQTVTTVINGIPQPALPVPNDWAVVEQVVPATAWRAGLNDVRLDFGRATRPVDVGVSPDTRVLSAAVDYVRVAVEER